MVAEGDRAPDFTAPLANGDVDEFTLSERLEDGPVVLAFFPGAFTSVCSDEMNALQERLAAFETADATVYGVSVDSPFALNEFREKHGLTFGMVSDSGKSIIHDYDVAMDFDQLGVEDVAKRAVFVVDTDGTVSYAWVSDDPGREPDYDDIEDAVAAVA